jgi:hypothetical protein
MWTCPARICVDIFPPIVDLLDDMDNLWYDVWLESKARVAIAGIFAYFKNGLYVQ